MTEEKKTDLESVILQRFQQQYQIGLRTGILSAGRIVLDKLDRKDKPLMERIRDVQKFCKVATESPDFLNVSNPDDVPAADGAEQ